MSNTGDDITERIAWPCGQCGGAAVRLIPCGLPPMSTLGAECLLSGRDELDFEWRYCARTVPRSLVFVVRIRHVLTLEL